MRREPSSRHRPAFKRLGAVGLACLLLFCLELRRSVGAPATQPASKPPILMSLQPTTRPAKRTGRSSVHKPQSTGFSRATSQPASLPQQASASASQPTTKPAAGRKPPYAVFQPGKWRKACRRAGLPRRMCGRITKTPRPSNVRAMAAALFQLLWWTRRRRDQRPKMPVAQRRLWSLYAKRLKALKYRRLRYQYRVLVAIDHLFPHMRTLLKQAELHQRLRQLMLAMGDRSNWPMELGRVMALWSWLLRTPSPDKLIRQATSILFDTMNRYRRCPDAYLQFLAHYQPVALARWAAQSGSWCRRRKQFLQAPFQTLKAVGAQLRLWQKQYPSIVALHTIGRSFEKRPIWALQLGERKSTAKQAHIVLVGGQHGNEHAGTEVLLDVTHEILHRYKARNVHILRWLRTRQIWIIPALNPDGKAFDLRAGVLKAWRFNRSVLAGGDIGIDLNRNYDAHWKPEGKCRGGTALAAGPAPFSAPETRALRDLVRKLPKVTAVLDLHQYGRLALYPISAYKKRLPRRLDRRYRKSCRDMTKANGYSCMPGHKVYVHCGSLGDWGHEKLKAFSMTLEVGCRKYIDARQLSRILRSNRGFLFRFIERGIAPFAQPPKNALAAAFPNVKNRVCRHFRRLQR